MTTLFTIIFALVFIVAVFLAYLIGNRVGQSGRDRHWEGQIEEHRKDAVIKSRAVLSGQFSEQISPYMPGFPFSPTECRFMGKPVDFLVFKGMDEKKIDEIVFVEVKSGKSQLSNQEKNLKEAVKNKRVSWYEYRVPEDVTKRRQEL